MNDKEAIIIGKVKVINRAACFHLKNITAIRTYLNRTLTEAFVLD